MSKKTHQQQLAARKAQRQAERRAAQARQRRNLIVTVTAALAVVVVLVGAFVLFGPDGGDENPAGGSTPSAAGPDNKPKSIPTVLAAAPKRPKALPAEVDCAYPKSPEKVEKKVNPPADGKVKASGTTDVTLGSSIGDLKFTLDSALAPCAVKSFVSLAEQKYFDNTSCHRLTVGDGLQVLQCGNPSTSGESGPGYSFKDEVYPQLKYGRGMLAMANSGPNTNGSQFFIVYGDASVLEPKYTAFGTVAEASLKAIDDVARAGVTPAMGPTDGKPIKEVKFTSAKVG